MKKIWNIVKLILFIVLILLLINCIIQKFQGAHHPKTFGYGFGIVLSGSMEPNLPAGSFIVIHEEDTYYVDEIITYNHYSGKSVTHRVVEANEDKIVTMGDANSSRDPEIEYSDITGKVVFYFHSLWIFIPVAVYAVGSIIYILIPEKKKEK